MSHFVTAVCGKPCGKPFLMRVNKVVKRKSEKSRKYAAVGGVNFFCKLHAWLQVFRGCPQVCYCNSVLKWGKSSGLGIGTGYWAQRPCEKAEDANHHAPGRCAVGTADWLCGSREMDPPKLANLDASAAGGPTAGCNAEKNSSW